MRNCRPLLLLAGLSGSLRPAGWRTPPFSPQPSGDGRHPPVIPCRVVSTILSLHKRGGGAPASCRNAKGAQLAGQLLFDISQIDLKGATVTAEEVGRLNPQCGDMRQLDRVIWLSPDRTLALGVKQVRPDEFWVPGHVPGRPLLPGVLMIEAAAQLCSVQYKKKTCNMGFLGFIRCDDVAFRGQVVPGDTLYLLGQEMSYGARRFMSAVQGVVNGKLVFEGKITGMVV